MDRSRLISILDCIANDATSIDAGRSDTHNRYTTPIRSMVAAIKRELGPALKTSTAIQIIMDKDQLDIIIDKLRDVNSDSGLDDDGIVVLGKLLEVQAAGEAPV